MDIVCKAEDDFIDEKSIWFVDLSNGERIWQDDGRPGMYPPQAWLRLRQYLKETNTHIVRFYIKFRSHVEMPLPENALGYFFCNKALAFYGTGVTIQSFLVGFFDGAQIQIQEWQLPEVLQAQIEQRKPEDLGELSPCLILKNGVNVNLTANS